MSAANRPNSNLSKIDRDGKHQSGINQSEQIAIQAWWTGTANPSQKQTVTQLLETLHDKGQWLACDCTNTPENPPVLAPAKVDDTIYLRRLMKRAAHHEDCIYAFEQKQASAEPHDNEASTPTFGAAPSFAVKEEQETKASEPEGQHTREQGDREKREPAQSRLAKQLYWLAQASGWQTAPKVPSHNAALREVAKQQILATDLTLNDLLYFNPGVWTLGYAEDAFEKCHQAGIAQTCWWLQIAHEIDRDRKCVAFQQGQQIVTIPVYKELTVFGGDVRAARHPLLVLAQLRKLKNGEVVLHSAYAHPVANDRLMLVDSDLERQTLEDLLAVCDWLWSEKSIHLTIDKPLHAWGTSAERPDFVITHKGRAGPAHFVIETMGYDDSEYEARKVELAANVNCPVFFDRRNADGRNRDMMRELSRWAIVLKKNDSAN